MSRTAIVTDSSAYLPHDLVSHYGIHVIPLYVHFGTDIYRDGVDIDGPTFYDKLRQAKVLPTTSQPSAGEFATLFRRLGEEFESIITILVTSKLSGTVGSALIARKQLQDEAVELGDPEPEIHIVDSLTTSGAQSMLVTAAARMAEAGTRTKEIVQSLETMIPKIRLDFVLDTLEYVRKGGRIGAAAALLGTLVRLKPILHMDNGVIGVRQKVRTAKKAMATMFGMMEERVVNGIPVHVAVLHADALEIAEDLKQKVTERFECAELFISEVSPAIGVHAGPGTIGLAYYQQMPNEG